MVRRSDSQVPSDPRGGSTRDTREPQGAREPHAAPARTDEPQAVAGGGLLHRRVLLQRALVLASAAPAVSAVAANAATTSPPAAPEAPAPAAARAPAPAGSAGSALPPRMQAPGQPFSNYGQPSPHERAVIRSIAANRVVPGNGVSWTPLEELEGMLTPSGLHFERHHNGVPEIDPARHELTLHGLVHQPLRFSVADLLRYPMRSHLIFIECGGNSNAGWHSRPMQRPPSVMHGMVSCSEWTGVPFSLLLNEAGLKPQARWAVAEGADAVAMNVSLPIEKLMDDCIVALYQNGERLRPEHGYPLRLVVPGWEGVLNVKWLRRLELSDAPAMTRNETAKYTELMPDGRARAFTFVMDAKSLITSPSHGQRLQGPNVYEIRGLAWSGRGRIRRVEVSADGGQSWADAQLQAPVLPRCLTRFRAAWRWDGSDAVLKSRATDETGYVQPERELLLQQRGKNGYFHYNAIVSWAVDGQGGVRHVYA